MHSIANYFPYEIEPSWKAQLANEFTKSYMQNLSLFLAQERYTGIPIYPPEPLVFNAFWKTPFEKVKVVILGQDPYHGRGQAHGLSFSVPQGVPPPPSLVNIYKELKTDLSINPPAHGCLNAWAEQGVLLLNTVLTVRHEEAFSHRNRGWERFTDEVIRALTQSNNFLVFILWGKAAQEKCKEILCGNSSSHLILKAPHPSPLSAHQGFFGSRPFSQTNQFLEMQGQDPIHWGCNP